METSPLRRFINRLKVQEKVHVQRGGSGSSAHSNVRVPIPVQVQAEAKRGLHLMSRGFQGGTATGHARARQLTGKYIDLESLADMRAWFARHGPDAANGGTSYRGYKMWTQRGSPIALTNCKEALRAPIAWLIWGGDPAYRWLKSEEIQTLLALHFPDRKQADRKIRL